ncbi:hypothetical protein [Daejeonella sp.]|uniref:hypothetical protein n=1 Tax=Daejeonella sp. TaxID=2805397 RepID=UPI0026B0BB70|nr:hypothetical protein [Daejeonella sp.]HQT23202.1 hypothetical protein [Daejeonella sp.]HQT58153.1 hypothetical protein [Daejeonella sp.]
MNKLRRLLHPQAILIPKAWYNRFSLISKDIISFFENFSGLRRQAAYLPIRPSKRQNIS